MGRYVLTRIRLFRRGTCLHLLVEHAQVLLQLFDLLLLTKNGEIQLFHHVFGKRQLRFQGYQAIFHGLFHNLLSERRPSLVANAGL